MGVAVCSGGTVKWSGAGDGSRWSDLANWVDGGTVDFVKAHVYDLSAAEDGANLVNDKVSSIGGFVLGAGQGTVTLSSTVAASALHGTWTIPASTTFVLKQVYRGMWSDYGTTTVSGGGTLRLDATDFQSANCAWNIEGGTVVELARGYPDLLLAQFVLRGGSVLRPLANGTKLGTLVVDATSCVALGDRTLTVCGGESGGYTMAGAVTGTGTIAFSGGKDISATASFPDFRNPGAGERFAGVRGWVFAWSGRGVCGEGQRHPGPWRRPGLRFDFGSRDERRPVDSSGCRRDGVGREGCVERNDALQGGHSGRRRSDA